MEKYSTSIATSAHIDITMGEERVLTLDDIHDPLDMVEDWVAQHDGRGLIAVGESSHYGEGGLKYQNDLLRRIQEQFGLSAVFLEEDEDEMPLVHDFYQTGMMSERLARYLRAHSRVRILSQPHEYKYSLVRSCREFDVPVYFIDNHRLVDRDLDWSRKIEKEIGLGMNGLYMLVAGRNHVLHKPMVRLDGSCSETVITLLDNTYSGYSLSLNVGTCDRRNKKRARGEVLESTFEDDLLQLGIDQKPSGMWLAGSPYEDIDLTTYNAVEGGQAFDALISIPGRCFELD